MPKRPDAPTTLDPALERATAVDLYNYTWTLLEREGRTEEEDELMAHAAHASRFHWERVGEPVNRARGEWLLARVYATLGRSEPALHHARRSLALAEAHGLGGFDLPFALEAVARAHAIAGDASEARGFRELAAAAAARIEDDEDRDVVLADLASISLPGDAREPPSTGP